MRILVCPLNWGLGHATRSSPIIDKLVDYGHEVHLASDGLAKIVLAKAYPFLPIHSLAPLTIEYGKSFWLKLFSQFFPFVYWMIRDHYLLYQLNKQYNFDLIISDSRPTCHLKKTYSVFITNQPSPLVPLHILQNFMRLFLKIIMKCFHEVWIPDLPGSNKLSGELILMPPNIKAKYLGLLSRMQAPKEVSNEINKVEVLAIVSGPEPMRSDFEKQLKRKLKTENALIVGGRPDQSAESENRYLSYLEPTELAKYLSKAKFVINRGGYSSLLDLAAFDKYLILVPTPGQSEQNYLAQRLASNNQAVIWDMTQESWDTVRSRSEKTNTFFIENDPSLLDQAILQLENNIFAKKNSMNSGVHLISNHWVFG